MVHAPVGAEDVGGPDTVLAAVGEVRGEFVESIELGGAKAAAVEGVGSVMTAVTIVVEGGAAAGLIVVEDEGATGGQIRGHGSSWQKEKDRCWAVLFFDFTL